MPCNCWIDDSEIEPEMKRIREHVKEIIKIAKEIHGKGDLYPRSGPPIPRSPLEDIHTMLDDIWAGKCSETGKNL